MFSFVFFCFLLFSFVFFCFLLFSFVFFCFLLFYFIASFIASFIAKFIILFSILFYWLFFYFIFLWPKPLYRIDSPDSSFLSLFLYQEKPLHELAGVSVQHSTVKLIIPKEFSKGTTWFVIVQNSTVLVHHCDIHINTVHFSQQQCSTV